MAQRRQVLVIDDDDAVLDYIEAKLGAHYDIVVASSAERAMRSLRARTPDLILCDIDMPGQDGGDVSAQLYASEETREIPLIYLTGLISPEALAERGGQLGGRAAVSKRAPLEVLLARIESAFKP